MLCTNQKLAYWKGYNGILHLNIPCKEQSCSGLQRILPLPYISNCPKRKGFIENQQDRNSSYWWMKAFRKIHCNFSCHLKKWVRIKVSDRMPLMHVSCSKHMVYCYRMYCDCIWSWAVPYLTAPLLSAPFLFCYSDSRDMPGFRSDIFTVVPAKLYKSLFF